MKNLNKYDAVIIGAGLAGATIANKFANANKKVLIIDKRNHIGGNAYDYFIEEGLIVHKYGPHIFHTNNDEVWDFMQQFSKFFFYEHRVLANVDGTLVPVPFNFKSIELTHPKDKAELIKNTLKESFKNQNRISILDLVNNPNPLLKEFGQFVYQKIFVYYTCKQWDIHPDKIDKSVINRIPVIIGYEDTYFTDKYQFMPINGYTPIFENMLKHKNIEVMLSTNIKDHIKFAQNKIYIDNEEYKGKFIYSGALDELFSYQYGVLPYRSLDFTLEKHNVTHYQPSASVNYTTSEKYTRITEYKYFIQREIKDKTIIAKEYSKAYTLDSKTDPYYPINNIDNQALYEKYRVLAEQNHIILCGRLAEYKYYNMDMVIDKALQLAKKIL